MVVSKGARIAVRTCMGVKRGERLLVVTDPLRLDIARELVDAARELGAKTTLLCTQVGKRHGEEPPDFVGQAMLAADVVIAPTTFSISHTQARIRASRAGVRIATMPGVTEDMMRRGGMLADYGQVRRLTEKVATRLGRASDVEVTAPAGTELRFRSKGRKAYTDTGIYRTSGMFGNLPAGEVAVAPIEGTAEGCVVVDGPIGDVARGGVEIRIRRGVAERISGRSARKILKILDGAGPKSRNVAEFGIGTNPKARLAGSVLEGEKVVGTCHVALGDNSSFGGRVKASVHIDGIFKKPTVKLDGKILMKDGRLRV